MARAAETAVAQLEPHEVVFLGLIDGPETYAKVSSVVHIIWNKQM